MKKLLAAAAVAACLAVAAPALAHDVAHQSDIAELSARIDALASSASTTSAAIDDLYALVDELQARIDAGDASWNQNAAIDDIYAILDRMSEAMRGEPAAAE